MLSAIIINAAHWYLLIGALCWTIFWSRGTIQDACVTTGIPHWWASTAVVLAWPGFVTCFVLDEMDQWRARRRWRP